MRYWKRLDQDGKTTTVESYSFDQLIPGAIETDKQEFDDFIAKLPQPKPAPDFKQLYKAAATNTDKIRIMAQMLGLET